MIFLKNQSDILLVFVILQLRHYFSRNLLSRRFWPFNLKPVYSDLLEKVLNEFNKLVIDNKYKIWVSHVALLPIADQNEITQLCEYKGSKEWLSYDIHFRSLWLSCGILCQRYRIKPNDTVRCQTYRSGICLPNSKTGFYRILRTSTPCQNFYDISDTFTCVIIFTTYFTAPTRLIKIIIHRCLIS